jgi:transcriptional regulator with XRE-family HTH domain
MDLKEIGVRLAKKRIEKNLSAYALSLRIGKAPNYIHRVECGQTNISVKALLEICETLDIPPAELFAER